MKVGIENARKAFGGRFVLKDFSLDLLREGISCLFGPSGCGKTTLLNAVAGLLPLDSGRITGLEGMRISCVFQEDRLLPWYTAEQNIALALQGPKSAASAQAEEWLCKVGLSGEGKKLPAQMSGGMKRKAAIARALAWKGDFYLLDEPFQRLDGQSRKMLLQLVKERIGPVPGLLVTHDREEAFALADTVYFLDGPPLRITGMIENQKG